jgi:UDP-N-acetylglucosamine 2-epimerase (non-hydrolysing)
MVVVQGDTTTSMASALASFYCGIPVAHVEAGLRTNNPFSPWPEEINRQIVARIASLHFAPTIQAGKNLEKENIPKASVHVTGNTVVDAMNIARELIDMRAVEIDEKLNKIIPGIQNKKIVLITGHRRESFGSDIESICYALSILANDFRNIHFIYPVHLNPNVIEPVHRILGKSSLKNIHLIEPLDYLLFIALMNRSEIILTDSGGIQEEAPGLGKPVMVTRNTTERTEGIQEAMAMLVGTGKEKIIKEMSAFLLGVNEFFKDAVKSNPYGDGNASLKIAEILNRYLR